MPQGAHKNYPYFRAVRYLRLLTDITTDISGYELVYLWSVMYTRRKRTNSVLPIFRTLMRGPSNLSLWGTGRVWCTSQRTTSPASRKLKTRYRKSSAPSGAVGMILRIMINSGASCTYLSGTGL